MTCCTAPEELGPLKRGEYRLDELTSTDVAFNYQLPLGQVNLFAQADILNVSNEQAQVNGSTAVRLIESFDPFEDVPVEGVHWEKRTSFGQATQPEHYQEPRTYRFSMGLRF